MFQLQIVITGKLKMNKNLMVAAAAAMDSVH
jgi:hypothetical protein